MTELRDVVTLAEADITNLTADLSARVQLGGDVPAGDTRLTPRALDEQCAVAALATVADLLKIALGQNAPKA